MKQTLRQLQIAYYSVYIAAIAAATSGFYILKSGFVINPLSQTGTVLNTLLIIFIIGSVPLSLGYFNKLTKKWALLEDENQRLEKYRKVGTLRIAVIGLGLVLGVLFFYIMNSQSMIFCAGIAAIALFFCKPSEAKISTELGLSL
jgi:hypothetical protein